MENFRFCNPTEIIFGKETETSVGKEVKKYSDKILLHYGGDTIKKIGLYDKIIKSLCEENINFIELAGVRPNPVLSVVRNGIDICRNNKISFILAVGGGSVIDSAKAIAAGTPFNGDVWDLFMGKAIPSSALNTGVVLTVPASGSESSMFSVITNEDIPMKKTFRNHLLHPKFAVLNPEITFSISAYQTSLGALDTMSHIFERYFTPTKKADLTDRLCEAAIKSVMENVKIAIKTPDDYNARSELMWASTIAHNGILGTGRIEDWASHRLTYGLGASYGITHGDALSAIIPAWMKYVYRQNIKRFIQFAVRIWGVDPCFGNDQYIAISGIEKFECFLKDLQLPTRIRDLKIKPYDLDKIDFEKMASQELQLGPVGNFMKLNQEDIVNIYKIAL